MIKRVAQWLLQSQSAVAFTGAGISTESGIPDFRSPGGVWAKYSPVLFDDFMSSADARYEYWRQKSEAHREFADAQPNDGHRVLSDWEEDGLIGMVITQNIDGLHQRADSQNVIELHGTAREVACMDCGARFEVEPMVEYFLQHDKVPTCPDCETVDDPVMAPGRLKHATVSFGQSLPENVLNRSVELSESCDLFLAIGSSLVVHPAAGLPVLANARGAKLVIINRDPTDMDGLADIVINDSIGKTLTAIDQQLGK